ncbi:hypothetical protein JTB14_016707 [Gonioctena quinquepunctata]|nr:hypothetical protein JTB14_016707 [Gonioctena quinquepunctata]
MESAGQGKQTSQLKEEIKINLQEIHDKIEVNKIEITNLISRLIDLERAIRKNNLIVFGLDVEKQNLLEVTLSKFNSALEENIVQNEIEDIYTIGDRNNQKPIVIIKFISYLRKNYLFANEKNFKVTGIAITNDLCFGDRKDKEYLKKHWNEAREQHLEATIKRNKLILNGEKFTVEKLKELEEQSETDIEAAEDLKDQSEGTQPGTSQSDNRKEIEKKRERIIYSPQTTTGGKRHTRRNAKNEV